MQRLQLTVNGTTRDLHVDEHEMLSSVIRTRLGLSGTKIGCQQGSCGACSVLVNSKLVLSCITPALRCDGAEILTIEGVAEAASLHALQKSFVDHGAIQCGYCTPGMVMTALEYTASHPHPSEAEIREALAGNVCRCTGYTKIVDAVIEYCASDTTKLTTRSQSDSIPEHSTHVVGVSRPSLEARRKVEGKAEYVDDIHVRGELYCAFRRSTHSHARIMSIDTSKARLAPGVRAVIDGRDLQQLFGVLPLSQDQPAIARDKVRFAGEIIAAVAAETLREAQEACSLIDVEVEELSAVYGMTDALREAQPGQKIHHETRHANNIHKHVELRFGDQDEALKKATLTSSMTVEFAGLNHAFTEPHASIAYWDENGLTVISATQVPHYLHRALAKVMEVPLHRVRVIKPTVGGGFGGKSDPFAHEMIVAHLARVCGRPVRCSLTREEVFLTAPGRHPSRVTMSMGSDADGNLQCIDANILIDGGAYASFGVVTTYYNGVLLQGPYKVDNFGFDSTRVYTNKIPRGAMRGHGAVNPRFVAECLIDDLARKSALDPIEWRMKNALTENSLTVGEFRITSNGLRQALQRVRVQSDWDSKFGHLPYGHGIGVASSWFISGSALPIIWNEYPQSVVHLKLDFDGRVLVSSGASDIGQGSDTMLAVIVAEVLGISLDRVAVVAADTLLTPVDLGSYSSRVTFMAGNAAKSAAERLRDEVLHAVSTKHEVSVDELHCEGGCVVSNDRRVDVTWDEAVQCATAGRGAITVSGEYNSPKLGGTYKGSGAGLSPSYSFGAMITEVLVDPRSGEVRILGAWGAHDVGKALNPMAVEGQLEGSWHMGLGQALTEAMDYHEGLNFNNSFLDYKIPTSLDTPRFVTNIIESLDPEGPFGAKECGEGALHPIIPALANAIYDAVGVRVDRVPFDAQHIHSKIREHATHEQEVATG